MNLVAADVSPLTYRPRAKLEPTHVGLLRFMVPMRGIRPWRLSMNLVAADVSRLTIRPRAKLEPTHVGLLRFMVPMRGIRPWRLSMNRWLNVTGSVSSLSPRGTGGERAGGGGTHTKSAPPH